jgi:hypothetical protein
VRAYAHSRFLFSSHVRCLCRLGKNGSCSRRTAESGVREQSTACVSVTGTMVRKWSRVPLKGVAITSEEQPDRRRTRAASSGIVNRVHSCRWPSVAQVSVQLLRELASCNIDTDACTSSKRAVESCSWPAETSMWQTSYVAVTAQKQGEKKQGHAG